MRKLNDPKRIAQCARIKEMILGQVADAQLGQVAVPGQGLHPRRIAGEVGVPGVVHGQPVGESVSAWVLASLDSHKLMRLGAIAELEGTGGGELCKTMTLAKLRQPGQPVPGPGQHPEGPVPLHQHVPGKAPLLGWRAPAAGSCARP